MMPGDDRGHCVMGTQAHELRRSGHSVRVQIRSGTDAQTAVILLQKILADVKGTAKREGENAFKSAEQPINDCFWRFSESDEVPF